MKECYLDRKLPTCTMESEIGKYESCTSCASPRTGEYDVHQNCTRELSYVLNKLVWFGCCNISNEFEFYAYLYFIFCCRCKVPGGGHHQISHFKPKNRKWSK